jgi:hypothetical protein
MSLQVFRIGNQRFPEPPLPWDSFAFLLAGFSHSFPFRNTVRKTDLIGIHRVALLAILLRQFPDGVQVKRVKPPMPAQGTDSFA